MPDNVSKCVSAFSTNDQLTISPNRRGAPGHWPDHKENMTDFPRLWLSILLPVYNVESYLSECIHSIVRQTANDVGIEIIIVDDGSTDGSRRLAERLCAQFSLQLKLVCHNRNLGVSAARNRLLEEARGTFVWFIDPDDYILTGAIEQLRSIVVRHDPDLILCDYRKNRFWKRRAFFGPVRRLSDDKSQLVRGVFKSRKMYCCVRVSRRQIWGDDLRFPIGRVFEDVATTPLLLMRTRNFYYIPRPWIHYRQRRGSIMDSVKRQPEVFDEIKHNDLAQALLGYKDELNRCLASRDASVNYYVADFCAKEFTKTARRMMRAQQADPAATSMPERIMLLCSLWEACSPIFFKQLMVHYLQRGRLVRYVILRYFLPKIRPASSSEYSVTSHCLISVSAKIEASV